MGLDMYVYTVKAEDATQETDLEITQDNLHHDLWYWRKHPNLHGWMEILYYMKGGEREEFNCTTVRLTVRDLLLLRTFIMNDDLPDTCGFFFGESENNARQRRSDLKFVKSAMKTIKHGYAVYYSSWW